MSSHHPVLCTLVVVCAFLLLLLPNASAAGATSTGSALQWAPCGDGVECSTATVPRDYARPKGQQLQLAVVRVPAQDPSRRIGSLFVNFGGPGGPGVSTIQAIGKLLFASLNDRFDIVSWDPRGVGQSAPAVDCKVNQETDGVYSQPFVTPATLVVDDLVAHHKRYIRNCLQRNPGILPYISTANTAHDLDRLRAAVGDDKLTYLGYSYGTFLGATYASLFPGNIRALVLDGAIDPDEFINRPLDSIWSQTAAFERALDRFFAACAARQDVCQFGGSDPEAAFDALVARLDKDPIPAGGTDPRTVDGDDVRLAALIDLYAKQFWPELATALALAEAGDGSLVRFLTDIAYGLLPDGTFDPFSDQFFAISALELRYPNDVGVYLETGAKAYASFPHFWLNSGYSELNWGLYPVEPRGVFYGPFNGPRKDLPTLVVGTTFDPATPYADARRLVDELGNARLLTMEGDGHTAYGGNSACIDAAVDAYLEDRTLPAAGTVCQQEVPFEQPAPVAAPAVGTQRAIARPVRRALVQHVR